MQRGLHKVNPLNTGGLFQCYTLVESSCHFRDVRSILSLLFYFWWKILLANYYVASDLGLHCLPTNLSRVSR